jgi:AraC-like DNA-binding protein
MEQYAFLFFNIALIFGCTILAVIFQTIPLPKSKGIRAYQLSLRFLTGAYLSLAIFKIIVIIFNLTMVNILRMEGMIIASLQASLFTFALITLINPLFVNQKYVIIRLIPVPVFFIVYLLSDLKWGDPVIMNYEELRQHVLHPTMIVRELFLLYYVFQLFYLSFVFFQQRRKYKDKIDNYFADNSTMHLTWTKYCFFMALFVGICALLSFFMFSDRMVLSFTLVYALFYVAFGLFYVRYPRTFIYIQPVIYPKEISMFESTSNHQRFDWNTLKEKIIADKYYLNTGITIEKMSLHLKIGRTSLSAFINQEENINFNAWINSLRVEEAKHLLLENPYYTMTQISEQIGYSEASNFSRQFKIVTNESPSVWRKNRLLPVELEQNTSN